MTKSTLTKDELNEVVATYGKSHIVHRMAKQLLAAMDSEPVAWLAIYHGEVYDEAIGITRSVVEAEVDRFGWEYGLTEIIPLYRHAQQPVVPDAIPVSRDIDAGYLSGWNACRAAMQGNAEPVSNRDELPLDYLQGQRDGLEWAAQMAEANHPQTGDWLYDDPLDLAKAIRKGPDMPEGIKSPEIPDGWVAFSEREPEKKPGSYEYLVFETLNNGVHHDYWNVPDSGDDCQFTPFWNHYDRHVTHWMPLPAAPQEVK
ncbi:DUF551 domain-containing protein [Klebsiella michiganensis]|uniref:DUF551 domain-containing protein n=1 Tax=Klebsiella michiganensis TaxID=1134687 RepID=UPI003B985032